MVLVESTDFAMKGIRSPWHGIPQLLNGLDRILIIMLFKIAVSRVDSGDRPMRCRPSSARRSWYDCEAQSPPNFTP